MLLLPALRRNVRGEKCPRKVLGIFSVPEQTLIDKLPQLLERLRNGEMKDPSFGLLGPESCLFFEHIDGKFVIDYQAVMKDELPYIEVLRRYAVGHGFQAIDTTYNIEPEDYDHLPYAPVLRIVVSADIGTVARTARDIESSIFHHNDSTLYDIVP